MIDHLLNGRKISSEDHSRRVKYLYKLMMIIAIYLGVLNYNSDHAIIKLKNILTIEICGYDNQIIVNGVHLYLLISPYLVIDVYKEDAFPIPNH